MDKFLIALLPGVAVLLAYVWLQPVPVTIDGRPREVRRDVSVDGLRDSALMPSRRGDLVSASDGRVLERGGGAPPRVYIDGMPASGGVRIPPGADVRTVDGSNVVEPIETVVETVPPWVEVEGRGFMIRSIEPGRPGRLRVRFGSVSKDVLAEKLLVKPVPMIVTHVEPRRVGKVVALTFDDGPSPRQTKAILDILAAEKVKATFFQVGERVSAHPGLSRLVVQRGMVLGSHGQEHRLLTRLPPRQTALGEMTKAERSIERATGRRVRWFRPPDGKADVSVYSAAERLHMDIAMWTVDAEDYTQPKQGIVQRVLSQVRPGSVVLMHDGGGDRKRTIQALPIVIRALKKRGYRFVTLDDYPGVGETTRGRAGSRGLR